jgi:hypothetical protein
VQKLIQSKLGTGQKLTQSKSGGSQKLMQSKLGGSQKHTGVKLKFSATSNFTSLNDGGGQKLTH